MSGPELVSAEEAKRLREWWDDPYPGGAGSLPEETDLAWTVEVQAWRIAELEAAIGGANFRASSARDLLQSGKHYDAEDQLDSLIDDTAEVLGGPSDA